MHATLDGLCEEGLLAIAVDGPRLVDDYAAFPRALETLVGHAGDPPRMLWVVAPLGTDDPGRPWREFEFVSPLLEVVEACAVVGEPADRDFLERLAAVSLPEAVVRFFPAGARDAALDWLRA